MNESAVDFFLNNGTLELQESSNWTVLDEAVSFITETEEGGEWAAAWRWWALAAGGLVADLLLEWTLLKVGSFLIRKDQLGTDSFLNRIALKGLSFVPRWQVLERQLRVKEAARHHAVLESVHLSEMKKIRDELEEDEERRVFNSIFYKVTNEPRINALIGEIYRADHPFECRGRRPIRFARTSPFLPMDHFRPTGAIPKSNSLVNPNYREHKESTAQPEGTSFNQVDTKKYFKWSKNYQIGVKIV